MSDPYLLSSYRYDYPESAVAQEPAAVRDQSALWVLDRVTGALKKSRFANLTEFLRAGDVVVINDVQVLPVRLEAKRKGGGRSEILLTGDAQGKPLTKESGVIPPSGREVEALISRGARIRAGDALQIGEGFIARILEARADGRWLIRIEASGDNRDLFATNGEMPLPPYLRRDDARAGVRARDLERYQTIFAEKGGAVAAPTAGLHFTDEVFASLRARGVEVHRLTLEVSFGTFRPIRVADLREHQMDFEAYDIPAETAAAIAAAKREGRRVIAVGTTVTRTLEAAQAQAGPGLTDLFIHTDYHFQVIDGLITNFHLPESSLLVLACAFGGRERVLAAYKQAITQGARLFSYGDAMLVV